MFFVLLFLILSATTASFFPEWSWASILMMSFACVAGLRILLAAIARATVPPNTTKKP